MGNLQRPCYGMNKGNEMYGEPDVVEGNIDHFAIRMKGTWR